MKKYTNPNTGKYGSLGQEVKLTERFQKAMAAIAVGADVAYDPVPFATYDRFGVVKNSNHPLSIGIAILARMPASERLHTDHNVVIDNRPPEEHLEGIFGD
jgi:hypothetical protein